jgi:type I restriction enzyme, S subunit
VRALSTNDEGVYFADTHVTVARPDPGSVVDKFLTEALLSPTLQRELENTCYTGSTNQVELSRSALAELELLLPPLPEQKKIAAILSSVDAAIEATEAVIEQLQVVKKAMMVELLTRGIPGRHTQFKMTEIGEVPEEWEVVPGENLFKLAGGYGPSDIQFAATGTALFLKVDDFNLTTNRRGLRDAALRFDPDENPRVKTYPNGSLVFPKRGAAIFKNRVQPLLAEATVDPNLMVLLPGPSIDPAYLAYQVLHIGLHNLSDNSGIPQLNNKHLYPHRFLVPSLDEQVAIRRALDEVSARVDSEEGSKAALVGCKTALMSVLLTGEIRVRVDGTAHGS